MMRSQGSSYCKPFLGAGSAKEGGKTIAIVGNGPLHDAQRSSIAGFDVVLRFNYLNNRYENPAPVSAPFGLKVVLNHFP